ncbi:MAG: hypothetical protein QOJ03_280 [Frankiaceae bacterium]|nr:hypothetical protein [Frankiaceae bacterium]
MSSTVAVVIITFRRPALLADLLASAALSDVKPAEVIVVDNDPLQSVDQASLPTGCVLVAGGFGINLAAARNAGWQRASSDLILFIDDDNVIAPNTVRALAAELDKDSRLALAAPIIWSPSGDVVWCGGVGRSPWTGRTNFLHRGSASPPESGSWDTFDMPDAFMIRRSALEEVRGFDEQCFPIHYDEADLCARMRQCGWLSKVVGGTMVRHFGFVGARPGDEYLRAMELHGVERVALMARSRLWFFRRHYRGLRRLTTLAMTPGWLLLACASTAVASAPLRSRLRTARALVAGTWEGYRGCASSS